MATLNLFTNSWILPAKREPSPQEGVVDVVLRLFNTNEYSDLTITCRNEQFKVHKALVCSRADYFQKACTVGAWKEGQEAIVELKGDEALPVPMDDPVLITHMLRYLYGLDYLEEHEQEEQKQLRKPKKGMPWGEDEEWTKSCGHEAVASTDLVPGGNARVHAHMCAVADFYGIPDLQRFARCKFGIALTKLRDVHHLLELLQLVCDPDFQGDVELRHMMVDKIARHDQLLDNPEIEAVLLNDAAFILAIAKQMRSKA